MRSHRIPPFCSACHRVEAWKDVQELVTLVGTQIANDRTIELTFPANQMENIFRTCRTRATPPP